MKVALVNPPWFFEGSAYLGCRDAHLPLELGYARGLLSARGHDVRLLDAQLFGATLSALVLEVEAFKPHVTVLTTAPSYLFWRCPPPELRVPIQAARALRDVSGRLVVVGPHASTTPRATLRKLGADVAVLGECEGTLVSVVESEPRDFAHIESIAYYEDLGSQRATDGGGILVQGGNAAVDMATLPPLYWSRLEVARHRHHHHRFDCTPRGAGAEVEASRRCPSACTFCAKGHSCERVRKRPLPVVLREIDELIACGARYVYFIDETFLPDQALLAALLDRDIEFGVQLRIEDWSEEMLSLLGRAGCVSIEVGVESITLDGQSLLDKRRKASTGELTRRLIVAKKKVPFVQANLIGTSDAPRDVAAWRELVGSHGVWSNEPVVPFPYPGSPEYRLKWGGLTDDAWERAHADYLEERGAQSGIRERKPLLSLAELERDFSPNGSEARRRPRAAAHELEHRRAYQ